MQTLTVKTERRTQLVDVTAQIQSAVSASKVANGVCYLYVPHTTAAITINECADPDVARDVEGALDRLIPTAGPHPPRDGNSDSHPQGVLIGGHPGIRGDGGDLVLGGGQ